MSEHLLPGSTTVTTKVQGFSCPENPTNLGPCLAPTSFSFVLRVLSSHDHLTALGILEAYLFLHTFALATGPLMSHAF